MSQTRYVVPLHFITTTVTPLERHDFLMKTTMNHFHQSTCPQLSFWQILFCLTGEICCFMRIIVGLNIFYSEEMDWARHTME